VAKLIDDIPRSRPAFFWWTLANAIAVCYAVLSWVLCLHVFRHPENPKNYEILRRLKRLPELTRHTALDAPAGKCSDPRDIYKKFFSLEPKDFVKLNEHLLRNYITNLEQPLLINYIEGEYQITDARKLDGNDIFQPGVAVRAQALVKPDEFSDPAPWPVVIEYLFPTADDKALALFRKNDIISVRKVPNCAIVLHATKVISGDEQKLCLTVVPIAYGNYQGEEQSFGIEPPKVLNPSAKLPVFSK